MKRRHKPPPRRWPVLPLLLLVSGALVVVALAGLALWPRAETPAVAFDPNAPGRVAAVASSVDLGRVPFDRMVEAQFKLVNTGGREVRLLGEPAVKTLEGC